MRFVSIGLMVMSFLGFPYEMYGGNIHLGPLRITPYITASGRYTDNVFLTNSNKKSDFYYSVLPGVKLRVTPLDRYGFYLNYDADYARYGTYGEVNYFVQSIDAAFDLNLPRRVGVKLGDKITSGADLPDFEGDRKAPYISNLFRIEASYPFSDRLNLGLRYSHGLKDYEYHEDEIDNSDTHTIGGMFRFRVLARTSMLLEYVYSATYYRRERADVENNYSNRINSGITWDITAKTRGTVRGGYVEKDYYALNRKDSNLFASANISHELTSRTVLSLTGMRNIFDTSNADDNIQFSSSYISNQVRASLQHTYRKFITSIGGGFIYDLYLHDDLYAGKKRKDYVWRTSVGIDYQMQRWIKLGVKYRYTNLNSNFDIEDYGENLIAFFVGLTL
ncbi:MAG: outer membrane beta-barrel protein [Syntrophobacterales bacterium]|nr:MAG: outer membrane beta-barrel protein [Syntrophobacterales bacterium]